MPRQLNASECRALFPLIFVAGWLSCAAVLAVAVLTNLLRSNELPTASAGKRGLHD